jgi:hypothetical protein
MMTKDYFLSKTAKIKVPNIAETRIGRVMSSMPFPLSFIDFVGNEYIIIENGILTHKGSIMSGRPRNYFQLNNFDRLLLQKKEVSYFKDEGHLIIFMAFLILPPARFGTEMELSLIDKTGKHHILIPKFLINSLGPFNVRRLQKEWESFLKELSRYSGLPLEETSLL